MIQNMARGLDMIGRQCWTCLMVLALIAGCGRRHDVATLPTSEPASATSPELLQRLRDLGGEYRLDRHGRVWALSFHRCSLDDGDLEILRSLPDVRTMTLRGVSVVGGRLSVEGLAPIDSLRELRRLDLSMNHRFTGRLDPLASLPKLEFLDLQGTGFGDEAMRAVARMPNLRTLRLGHLGITDEGLKALQGSSLEQLDVWLGSNHDVALLGGLKELRVWFTGYDVLPVDRLREFAGADQLQEIWLTCHGVECPLDCVRALHSMRSLQTVHISGPADSDWPILAALDGLSALKTLRLDGIGDRALRQLPSIKSLETLCLARSSTGSEEGLRRLSELPNLRHLALRPETTTAGGLASVAACSHLETLEFQPSRMGGFRQVVLPISAEPTAGFVAEDLRPVLRHTALRTLRVDGLGFGDELMAELVAATNLQYLGVSGLPITDAGLEHVRHLKHLRVLDIVGTAVTYDAAARLHRDYLPQCRITDNWCCGCLAFEPRVL
jgi:hypothetical protein